MPSAQLWNSAHGLSSPCSTQQLPLGFARRFLMRVRAGTCGFSARDGCALLCWAICLSLCPRAIMPLPPGCPHRECRTHRVSRTSGADALLPDTCRGPGYTPLRPDVAEPHGPGAAADSAGLRFRHSAVPAPSPGMFCHYTTSEEGRLSVTL